MSENLTFRSHARLLTMLGEQLIKNERIALVELVKNSYDADATEVRVDFRQFGVAFEPSAAAAIVITDNGDGMPEEVIRGSWMNPATPSKASSKLARPTTSLGRVIQGEMGIGRFATFKLGNLVTVVTRARGSETETTLVVDITALDDSASEESTREDFLLEDVAALLDVSEPSVFVGAPGSEGAHGTQIAIQGLRADWDSRLVRDAFEDLDRLQPLMWSGEAGSSLRADFRVDFLRDGVDLRLGSERAEEFEAVLERAVLKVSSGSFDDATGTLAFDVNARRVSLQIDDAEVRGLRRFRRHFETAEGQWHKPQCGPFEFEFYVFDFSTSAPAQHSLDRAEKEILKNHRTYLYRDGIRVYPYGDPQDDWLEVDAIRGTESARSMFSNDQMVGYVKITQAGNPKLRDKTNREGLLETGRATRDFVVLVQTVLSYLRSKPYEQYAAANRRARERDLRTHRLDRHIKALRKSADLPDRALKHLDALEASIRAERELASMQVARTEQLAGVGLSVETASHDLIAAGIEALRMAKHIVADLRLEDLMQRPVYAVATSLVTRLEFVNARFQDVQGLFVSTRQKRAALDVIRLTKRVRAIYGKLHADKNIAFEIDESIALEARSTEGAVLQCMINLVDNATYWLMTSEQEPRVIRAFARDARTLVLTDNGPGVKPQDEPFIFEPFYSGKGDAGKGLGLYIARQNGLRNGFSVQLGGSGDRRELPGATFVVSFSESKESK